MPESSEELSVLKSTINKPIDKLETFPAPKNVTNVKFFRKGQKDSWKSELNKELRKEIEKIFKNEMVELGYL